MAIPFYLLMFVLSLASAAIKDSSEQTRMIEIAMPHSHPEVDETYLCTPMKLDKATTNFLIGFHPNATSKTAHHMLLYGCKNPGYQEPIFNCGSMSAKNAGLNSALHPCGSGHQEIIYAWAQNAPDLTLPEDVAFRVGGPDSDIDWLVLQVHYATVKHIPAEGDTSGVSLEYTHLPKAKSAGVLLLGTNGRIPSSSTTHMEVACSILEDEVVHPFAFRVHTHSLGRVVSGWKVVDSNWSLLGKEDPQLPQMFYPVVDDKQTLTKGDTVAARCTMINDKDHAVWVGSTRDDEMCNFYLMYWMNGERNLKQKSCTSVGPPIYYWDRWLIGGGLSNVPDDNQVSEL
jgi:peptidylglycine monooxygenase